MYMIKPKKLYNNGTAAGEWNTYRGKHKQYINTYDA